MATEKNTNLTFLRLPSIYKPFYIQRLYAVNLYDVESSRNNSGTTLTESTNTITSVVNVYNGIGLLAHIAISGATGEDVLTIKNAIGKLNYNLKRYFSNDSNKALLFYKNIENMKQNKKILELPDLYAIGLLEDKISIYDGLNEAYINSTELISSIYRDKPLILSDYNYSVKDIFKSDTPSFPIKNIGKVRLSSQFTSVKIGENNNIVNRDINEERTINFGNLNVINGATEMNTQYARIKIKIVEEIVEDNKKNKFVINNELSTAMDEVIGIIGHFNTEIDKEVRYYVVNEAFINNFCKSSESSNISNGYCKEYVDNREQYDLKMNEFTYEDSMTNIPFLNMTPALKNTEGYYYSDNEVNVDFPFAMEVYCELSRNGIPSIGNTNYSYFYNLKIKSFEINNTNSNINLYLIGVYSPLTALSGACCVYEDGINNNEDTPYVREIKNGSELIPQIDSTTIIMNFGLVYEPTNSEEGGSGGSSVTPRT